ncbi:MAG: aldolase/citrate lyase family protein [Acidobacteriota bacterium]
MRSAFTLRKRLATGEEAYGLFCSVPAAIMVELIAAAGYHFIIIDLEHTLITGDQLEAMLLAARANGVAALVRVAALSQVLPVLDAGAEGVVFPRIRSAQQAHEAVSLCRYWPDGERGLNATRDSRYARDSLTDYLVEANCGVMVWLMIEDIEGLQHLNQIATVAGIDVLLEGAADLSQSFGLPWQTRHSTVREGLATIHSIANQHGLHFCALPRAAQDHSDWREKGVRLFIVGDDRGLTWRGMAAHLSQYQLNQQ